MEIYQSKISKNDLLNILNDIDRYVECITRKIKIYPIGGSKLTLDDAKAESKDIDVIASRADFRVISDFVGNLEFERKIRIDVFPDAQMSGYSIPFYESGSTRYPYHFRNIELYSLDNAVFCLTKGLTERERDIGELKAFLRKYPISLSRINSAYSRLKINPQNRDDIDKKLELFIRQCYPHAAESTA